MLVRFTANAVASATTGMDANSDIIVVGTHYVNGTNLYLANANSGGARATLTAAAVEEYESKLANIARGDYVVING